MYGDQAKHEPRPALGESQNQNIGLDFSLFNNRVTGSFNYFIRKQEDLLGDYQTSVPQSVRHHLHQCGNHEEYRF